MKTIEDFPQITIDKIAKNTGISNRTVSRIIKELKEKRVIYRKGTKKGTWIIINK